MARKEKKDIPLKDLNVAELTNRLEKTREDLFKVKFRAASAPLKDTMAIRRLRKDVARLNTFINQKRGQ